MGSLNVYVPGAHMIRPHEKFLIALTVFSMLALVRSAGADDAIRRPAGELIATTLVATTWPTQSWSPSSPVNDGEVLPEDGSRPLSMDLYGGHPIRPHAVPEPYGYLLAAVGLLGLLGMGTAVRRRRKTTLPSSGGEQSRKSGSRHRHVRSSHTKKRSLAHS